MDPFSTKHRIIDNFVYFREIQQGLRLVDNYLTIYLKIWLDNKGMFNQYVPLPALTYIVLLAFVLCSLPGIGILK